MDLSKEMELLKEENAHLKTVNKWMLEAQERSADPRKKQLTYLATAEKAQELLNNEAFNVAYTDLIVEYQRIFINSLPEEIDLREDCHRQSQVLQKLLLKLNNQVKAAQMK